MIAGICFALLKIKTAKTDALEPATQPVSMAGCGIGLHAHERDRMIGSVEKEVHIPPGEAVHNVLVVPEPNSGPIRLTHRPTADVTWYPETWDMKVAESSRFDRRM
jgi:hypothetical protein